MISHHKNKDAINDEELFLSMCNYFNPFLVSFARQRLETAKVRENERNLELTLLRTD